MNIESQKIKTLYYPNEKIKYHGSMKGSYYHYYGILYTESGNIQYEGEFYLGKYNGYGELYENNTYHGYGSRYMNNTLIENGYFRNGIWYHIDINDINRFLKL